MAPPLLLAVLLALAQLEAADEALSEGDAEGVPVPELVVLDERDARPLLLDVLLALSQLVADTLTDVVVEPQLVTEGVPVALEVADAVAETEEERVALAEGEALGDAESVVEAERHSVAVGEPDDDAVPQSEADALAHRVGRSEELTLAVKDSDAEVLAHAVGDAVVETDADAHTEGEGEPVANVVPELVSVALPVSVAQPEELPLVE